MDVTVEERQQRKKDRYDQTSLKKLNTAVYNRITTHHRYISSKLLVSQGESRQNACLSVQTSMQPTEISITKYFDTYATSSQMYASTRNDSARQQALRDQPVQILDMMSSAWTWQKNVCPPCNTNRAVRTLLATTNGTFIVTFTGK